MHYLKGVWREVLLFLLLVITVRRLELFSSLSYQNSAHPVPLCGTYKCTHAHTAAPPAPST